MKAVVLLAGLGRRMSGKYVNIHKSLIPLYSRPLLAYLLRNIELAHVTELIPVVGHKADDVLGCIEEYKGELKIHPVYNHEYSKTNNLVSLLCAEDEIKAEGFILCNGDMVFDHRILDKIIRDNGSRIAVDKLHKNEYIDSPRVKVDGKVLDLGRHISIEDGDGYAIGIYKFGQDMVSDFFKKGHELCQNDMNHGFHDPLGELFTSHNIYPTYVENLLWKDIDEESDIRLAEDYVGRIIDDYK